MPKFNVGQAGKGKAATATKQSATPTIEERLATLEAEKNAKDAIIATLQEQLAAKATTTAGGRVYAPAATPREVAVAFLAEYGGDGLRDLHHLMVQRIPNTVTADKPYGKGVLHKNQSGQEQYRMKDGADRGVYINLGKLAKQVYGDPMQYRKPQPLSDEQIDKVLRPALDHLHEIADPATGKPLFEWSE